MALSNYVTEVRRLLHDSSGRVWDTPQLVDYINEGRMRTALDTHCLRSLEDVTLVLDQEVYPLATLTTKLERAIDLANLTVLWGTQRVPLLWYAWTEFNALLRIWQPFTGRPCAMAFFGGSPAVKTIYIRPVPDQNYDAEADVFYIPEDLVDDSSVDELSYPFNQPVAYYASSKAKEQEQSYGEAEIFMRQYAQKAMGAINSFTRYLPNAYR